MIRAQARAFALYMLVFWIAILLPFQFYWPEPLLEALRAELITGSQDIFELNSLVLHAALFFPLGVLLEKQITRRNYSKAWIMITAAATLAVVSELAQLFVENRGPSLNDVAGDFIGFGLGCVGAYYWRRSTALNAFMNRRHTAWLPLVGVIVMTMMATFLLVPIKTSFSNWDPEFPLLLANENTQNRPWHGELYEVMLLDWALSDAQARRISPFQSNGDSITEDNLIIHYTFSAPDLELDGGAVREVSASFSLDPSVTLSVQKAGNVVPILGGGIRIEGDSTIKSNGSLTRLYKRLQQSGELSLIVRFRAKDLSVTGPARIVSLSSGSDRRNFTLGQAGSALHFRVRNPLTGENGIRPELVTRYCLDPEKPQVAVAVYDGATSRLYVDGVQHGKEYFTLLRMLVAGFVRTTTTPELMTGVLLLAWALFTFAYYFSLRNVIAGIIWREFAAAMLSAATLGAMLGINVWLKN